MDKDKAGVRCLYLCLAGEHCQSGFPWVCGSPRDLLRWLQLGQRRSSPPASANCSASAPQAGEPKRVAERGRWNVTNLL